MQDFVPLGTGNSRLMKSNIPAGTTWEQAIAMLNSGTFPYDTGQLNAAGISVEGTPLNKQTLLQDTTAQQFGLTGDATVDQVLQKIAGNIIGIIYSGTTEPSNSIGSDGDYYIQTYTGKSISTLNPGDLVKLNENGQAKQFIFLEYDHYGMGEVTLIRKDTFATKAFKGGSSGRNGYNGSDLDMFCNVEYPIMLDHVIQSFLVFAPIPTARGAVNSGTTDATVVNLYRRGFALSCEEVFNQYGVATEGTAFSYFSGSAANRIAYYDETTNVVNWWLRSPYSSNNSAYSVNVSGIMNYDVVVEAHNFCPRPAIILSFTATSD